MSSDLSSSRPIPPSALHAADSGPSLPMTELVQMRIVAVVGSFAGLSPYDPANPPTVYDATASTLVARTAEGDLRNLGATDTGGGIRAICETEDGSVFVGGNFTSLGNVDAANIASYNPSSETFSALAGGLYGEVRALSCNGTSVYAGGDFAAPQGLAGAGANVAHRSVSEGAWTALPFYGFDAAVESIFESEDRRALFFCASFSAVFSNSSANPSSSPPSSATFSSLDSFLLSPVSTRRSLLGISDDLHLWVWMTRVRLLPAGR
ncbi:hypothetical protein JCM11641_004345 [Rhodosporidiobolus odoratus]